MTLESQFQSKLVKELKHMFPGCIVLKNDPNYLQGIPDLSVFYRDSWAMLEVKGSEKANHRPNQDHYIGVTNEMSFARFIYPENKEEVLHELQHAFGVTGTSFVPKSK